MLKLTISPYWLLRLFGVKPVFIVQTASSLVLKDSVGESWQLLPETLADESAFQQGHFFASLRFKTDRGDFKLRWLKASRCWPQFLQLKKCWLQQLQPDVLKAMTTIDQQMKTGYPRQSKLLLVQKIARVQQQRFGKVPLPELCSNIDVKNFELISQVAAWSEADYQLLRRKYVSHQIGRFQSYFDQVESKPLTSKQREACVIDEDNNLVLAGAGTGKTSTMVGRAGFLLQSGQARPEQILMLAFANKAAAEMQERIEKRLGDCGITASTFHKVGKDIIVAVEGKQPSLSPLVEDQKGLAAQVNRWFEAHLTTPVYQQLVLQYFRDYLYPVANPFEFSSEGAYFDFLTANDIRTLKGELVKSYGECLVANHLFRLGIEYIYEADYELPTATVFHRQYRPDFYLPEHGVYIEYFGTDRLGNTAPYIDALKYQEGMAWKRQLHKINGTRLIELFHYDQTEGRLYQRIEQQLKKFGIAAEPLPAEALLESLREFGAISAFAALLTELLQRYRANCYAPGQLEHAITGRENEAQLRAAMTLLLPVVDDYVAHLHKHQHIDFDDMIGKAIHYIQTKQFKSQWRFILVDEFQDISDARARLIKALRDSVQGASLFCVGDDWQAIYRFTGSDLSFTTAFRDHFGATQTTALDLTFRFNSSISEVASRFVLQNPQQVTKQLNTLRQATKPEISLLRADNRQDKPNSQTTREASRLEQVLVKIAGLAASGSSVYLLARYGFVLPDKSELKLLNLCFPTIQIEAFTIHASKGKEADYVVILGLEKGKHGFPSEKQTHPLLDALLPAAEAHQYAEERRLLYVAITRARHRVYLIADMAVASEFVIELIDQQYPVELNEFPISLSQQLFQLIHCSKCKTGTLIGRQSAHGAFFGCSKFPLCNHKERGCQSCGSPMKREGRFKICINPACDRWTPTCPKCGAEMVLREGRFGQFWGCRNYRKEVLGCGHTENQIVFN